MDDALNSNDDNGSGNSLYEQFYRELLEVHRLSGSNSQMTSTTARVQGRRAYANLDIGSMGVDITHGPITKDPKNLDVSDNSENHNLG